MNAVFDFKRFLNLEKRNLLTHKNQFLYASLIIIGYFIFSVLLSFLNAGLGQFFLMGIYPVCFLVIVFAPGFFEKNIQRNNSIFDFILPGSTFEKFLVMLLNYVVLVPLVCFTIVFLLVQLIGIIPMNAFSDIADSLSFNNKMSWISFLVILTFQSFFFVGYLYFKRFSFVKTLLIFVGVIILLQVVFMILGAVIFKNMSEFNQISQYSMMIDFESLETFQNIKTMEKVIKTILCVCFPFGLWVVSFFKLREKEI